MKSWVLGDSGASDKVQKILSLVETMDSETIHGLVTQIWLYYDDAVLRETGKLYNLGEGDPHWEGHL